jgi:hypothetical protein
METPKVIKFRNGDLVIAKLHDDKEGLIRIENPIAVVPYPMMQGEVVGETFLLKPWIGITEEKTFLIRKSEIMTVCTLRPNLLEQYNRYVSPEYKFDDPSEEEEVDVDLETIRAGLLRDKNLLN